MVELALYYDSNTQTCRISKSGKKSKRNVVKRGNDNYSLSAILQLAPSRQSNSLNRFPSVIIITLWLSIQNMRTSCLHYHLASVSVEAHATLLGLKLGTCCSYVDKGFRIYIAAPEDICRETLLVRVLRSWKGSQLQRWLLWTHLSPWGNQHPTRIPQTTL